VSRIRWSVVITTKDRFSLLRRAIESCFAQTIPCEVLVVDDGSTDETSSRAELYPGVVYIRHEVSKGHCAAANAGIAVASGDWIKALDDDDFLDPRCLERMTSAIKAAPADANVVMASCRAANVTLEGKHLGRTRTFTDGKAVVLDSVTLLRLMMLDQAPVGTPVQVGYRRDAALTCGGWNVEHVSQYGDEGEFWIRLAHIGGCIFLPECLGFRTIWEGGSQKHISHVERYRSCLEQKRLIGEVPHTLESSLALHWAAVCVKEGNWRGAVHLLGIWMRRPWSTISLIRARTFLDARRVLRD
jgi:glycosyltransferase involved in cell wall biosynthesis